MGGSAIQMYLDDQDIEMLVGHLDEDEELAWLVPNGDGCWRAQSRRGAPHFGYSTLWHVPSGPLPHAIPPPYRREWIDDPWSGWRELRSGAISSTPYFGPGWPGTYLLYLRPWNERGEITDSSLQWIGNHYAFLGDQADPATERHWRRLRQWVKKHSRKLTSDDLPNGSPLRTDIFTFPAALAAIKAGATPART